MVYDLVLPLMSELFRFSEGRFTKWLSKRLANDGTVNDNEELTTRASMLLTRMCAVSPPADLLEKILDSVFDAIKTSTVSQKPGSHGYCLTCLLVMESESEGFTSRSR
jgi:proteasome activator subunit 4